MKIKTDKNSKTAMAADGTFFVDRTSHIMTSNFLLLAHYIPNFLYIKILNYPNFH